jgi:PAS domain S-box-containing protein
MRHTNPLGASRGRGRLHVTLKAETGSTPGLLAIARRWRWVVVFVLAVLAVGMYWTYSRRSGPAPRRTYRIGFEENPPYHFRRPDGGVGGIAYDVISEAARRVGLRLDWVECPESSEAALRSGRVDLWPLVTDLPERRRFLYISQPWMQTDHFFVVRDGQRLPDAGTTGRLAHGRLRIHARLLREHFPHAEPVSLLNPVEVVREVCVGRVIAGLLGAPQAMDVLRARPPECANVQLKLSALPAMRFKQGVGSTFQARPAADELRDAIATLAREGTLAGILIHYSFFSLDETSATYDVLVAEERAKWLSWGVGVLALALAFTVWLSRSLYKARRLAEAANAVKQEFITRYATAARATNDVIWDLDPVTGQIFWHEGADALFGYADQDVGPDVAWRHEHIHPADRNRVAASLRRTLAQGEHKWSEEYRFRCADGTHAHVVDRAYVIYDQSNRPVRVIGAMMDMTPLRRLEQRLVQSERLEAVGRLAGGVAHDFNNLLTAILGYASALKGSRVEDAAIRAQDLEQIEHAANRAADLTQQLLAFSRRQLLQPELLHLDKVLAEVDNLVRRLIGEHIAIQVKRVPDLGCVQADKGQLTQVILNLCINARDAMPHGGTLEIETANVDLDSMQATQVGVAAGRYVLLAVTDTGEGMDAETQQRIFEPFFTTKPMGQGTGLGLATVYGIVKQSGGSISVDSDVGRGSTFRVYLPRTERSESAIVERPAVVARDRGMETVLTVEDDVAVRDIVARTLAEAGYTVLTAQNPEEALQISRAQRRVIHLVLTDVVMPGMDGTQLVERLKDLHPEAKVLYMSGYADNVVTLQGVLAQGHAFLAKPFTPNVLRRRVRQVLDNQDEAGRARATTAR